MGDHTETLQIDFDPGRVPYGRLLELFWREHDPTSKSWSTQYKAAVFFHTEAQRREAVETRDRLAVRLGREIHTEILPYTGFTAAEAYHQKYYLRQNRQLLEELQRYYPQGPDLMNSTAAARVNGYLGRNGSRAALATDIDALGLSGAARRELLKQAGAEGRGKKND
jgi:hypothetical protein